MSTQTDPPVNPNKALWEKGDFTRIAESDARERRGSRGYARSHAGPRCPRSRLRRRHDRGPEAQLGANVLGVDIAENLVAAGNARAQQLGLANLRFQQGDATDLKELADDSFDLVVIDLRRDVRAQAIRCREGGRPSHPAGRPDRDGELDPGRPDLRRAAPPVSMAYSPPPPEGFVSPMTWGVEENVSSGSARPASRPRTSPASGRLFAVRVRRRRRRNTSRTSGTTTGRR